MANPNLLGQGAQPAVSLVQQILFSGQLASGDNPVLTVASSSATKVATGSLCNTSASIVTISVSVLKSSDSLDGTHKVISSFPLGPNDTICHEDGLACLKGLLLGPGEKISINASAASAVDCVLTGAVTS